MLLQSRQSEAASALADLPAQLRLLADSVESAVQPALAAASASEASLIVGAAAATPSPNQDLEIARQLYAMRRRRGDALGAGDLFGEPAWDILLDLFIAAGLNKQVPVSSACIGAAVPPTTALRWLNQLEQHGLVLRENDPDDARRTYVRISPAAQAALRALLRRFAAALALPCDQAERRPNAEAPA